MQKKWLLVFCVLTILLTTTSPALAAGYFPWKNHAAPLNFLFGNEIDTHQQSRSIAPDQLAGFLYIHDTGEKINGIPVAEHTDCAAMPGACTVGWDFQARKADARLLQADMDMPTWCLGKNVLSKLPAYSHFHWLGQPAMGMDLVPGNVYHGVLIKLVAAATFYFRHHDTLTLVRPGVDIRSHANVQACS